jgi:hypothetical protein
MIGLLTEDCGYAESTASGSVEMWVHSELANYVNCCQEANKIVHNLFNHKLKDGNSEA